MSLTSEGASRYANFLGRAQFDQTTKKKRQSEGTMPSYFGEEGTVR